MFLHKAMRYYRLWIYSCNLVLLVSVLLFVALAAWALSDFHMDLFPSIQFHQPTFIYAYAALVLQGGILQAVGCVGALRMNERLLNAYWSLMLGLLVGDLIVGLVWIFRYQHLSANLGPELRSRLQNHYGLDRKFELLWDQVQMESRCCGVHGPVDYANSSWLIHQRKTEPRWLVPRSCCLMQWDSKRNERVPLNMSCVEGYREEDIHQSGCLEPVHRWLQRHADMLSVLGFCVIAFLKVCFLGILRYEIREMIQKIKILKLMDDQSPGTQLPVGQMASSGLPGFEPYIPKTDLAQTNSTEGIRCPNNNLPGNKDGVKSPNGNNNDPGGVLPQPPTEHSLEHCSSISLV